MSLAFMIKAYSSQDCRRIRILSIILRRCLQGLHSFGKCVTLLFEFFYDHLTFRKRGQVAFLFEKKPTSKLPFILYQAKKKPFNLNTS